jgi:effector-binding domain-containing protein
MTAPVRTDRDGEGVRMEFVLPAEYTPETAPRPTDPRVELVIRPSRTIAALAFSGSAGDRKAKEIESKLLETLAEEGIEAIDEPTLLQYNDPYTPPFMRRNEVAVEVVADDAAAAVGDRS